MRIALAVVPCSPLWRRGLLLPRLGEGAKGSSRGELLGDTESKNSAAEYLFAWLGSLGTEVEAGLRREYTKTTGAALSTLEALPSDATGGPVNAAGEAALVPAVLRWRRLRAKRAAVARCSRRTTTNSHG
jgi:hypothetical protein